MSVAAVGSDSIVNISSPNLKPVTGQDNPLVNIPKIITHSPAVSIDPKSLTTISKATEITTQEISSKRDYFPSVFHDRPSLEILKNKTDKKALELRLRTSLVLNPNNITKKLALANTLIHLADPNQLTHTEINETLSIYEDINKTNYFTSILHYVKYNILLWKKIHFTSLEEIKNAILALRRTLAIDPQFKTAEDCLRDVKIWCIEKWGKMLEDSEITSDTYNSYINALQRYLEQDPFEEEVILPDQLAKAPPTLVSKYPSLRPRVETPATTIATESATPAPRTTPSLSSGSTSSSSSSLSSSPSASSSGSSSSSPDSVTAPTIASARLAIEPRLGTFVLMKGTLYIKRSEYGESVNSGAIFVVPDLTGKYCNFPVKCISDDTFSEIQRLFRNTMSELENRHGCKIQIAGIYPQDELKREESKMEASEGKRSDHST